jgi:FMN-dependent NADH-azoreductase
MRILRITSSLRKENSQSIKLGAIIVEKLLAANPGATVKHKDLTASPFPHLEEVHLKAFYAPAENHLPGHDEAIRHSDEAIAEIKEADVLVIEAPLYNLTISSTLKAWLDHIIRAGVTFNYTPNGAVGLITGKKVYVAVSAGGVYSDGPGNAKEFVTPLLRALLGRLGMTDITFIIAEGLNVPSVKETAFQKAVESITV